MSRQTALSLSEKISLLDKIKNQPLGTSVRELEKILNVPKSTISRLKSEENALRKKWEQTGGEGCSRKRKREGKDPDVENALNQWFAIVTGRGVRITGPMLKTKAEELAKKMDHNDFKATDGWLGRWKKRNEIKFKKAHGEKGSADHSGADDWVSTKLPQLLKSFTPENIYNADETGLFYRATPDGSLCSKHQKLVGSKKAMDRVTVLCCCNMTGSDKRKLLVIGKSANPRCFKNLKTLPVSYYANKNAWMTAGIFRTWLLTWDAELQSSSRKILLLTDNCAAHPSVPELKHIQLEFIPPNTTSLIQPLDMGIIKNLKHYYREFLVQYILEAIEDTLMTENSTAKDISAKITVLQAIQFVTDSWRKISNSTIKNCFVRCGFRLPSDPEDSICDTSTPDHQSPLIVLVKNHEEFCTIDDNLPCYGEYTDCENEIVEKLRATNETSNNTLDDEEDAIPETISTKVAKKCLEQLRLYIMQEGGPTSSLNECADFVQQQSVKKLKQSTLDKYLSS